MNDSNLHKNMQALYKTVYLVLISHNYLEMLISGAQTYWNSVI
jgi:hypothetical protein